MSPATNTTTRPRLVMDGVTLGESPRWHDGAIWFADWGPGEIVRVGQRGEREVVARAPAPPLSFDFLPDGELVVVHSRDGRLLRRSSDGALEPYAAFGDLAEGLWNEIVVDGRANAYVNGGCLVLVTPDGRARRVADGGAFPNGMAVTADNAALIMAESHARQLTGFDIGADGSLSNRRVWAPLGDYSPDGICIDAEGCVWFADVPNRCCARVRQGGEIVQTIPLDQGAFACMLGGPERRTLYITAATWLGMDRMGEMQPDARLLAIEVDVPGAGWP
jgi:sugar lactone lactonase YvrE